MRRMHKWKVKKEGREGLEREGGAGLKKKKESRGIEEREGRAHRG